MKALLYGIALQWKLDIRSKTLLITCYMVPLLFFAIMGGIFTSIMPESKDTLIPAMTVMGVSMGALIGLPPSLVEIYGSDIKKVYKANGIPIYFGFITTTFSAMIHLLLMSVIIYTIAPFAFEAKLPTQSVFYFISLIIFIMISLSVGSILGLVMKKQAKVTMISQLVFLPSIMLSGIMFPIDFLPDVLRWIGMIFPAAWGYQLMLDHGFDFQNLWPMMIIFVVAVVAILLVLRKIKTDET